MLSQTRERYNLAEQALTNVPKVAFNHVFSEVKKENEMLMISKMFKTGGSTKGVANGNGGGSNYMSGTHSWTNKNKATGPPPSA